MRRFMRLYYEGILGAIGGVIGWQVSNLMGLSFTRNVYLSEVIVGAILGFCIGWMIGMEEWFSTLQPLRAVRAAGVSGLLGACGGAMGLPLAEAFFQLLGGQSWGRALGWSFFGILLGLVTAARGGSQAWKGALGGFLGGLGGGLLLEGARTWLENALIGKGIGLALLGGSVGAFIAMIAFLLSRAWFEVTSGKLKGTEFILDKFMHRQSPAAYIGSDALKADIVLPDPDVAPQHALLKGADTHFTLKDLSLSGTFVQDRRIEQAVLKDHQTVRLGNTQLVYHEKR